MPRTRGVRIVKGPGNRSNRNVEVFDLETGEKILNVYRIQIDIDPSRGVEAAKITLTTGDAWEFEGPAEFDTVEQPHFNTDAMNRWAADHLVPAFTKAIEERKPN